MANLIKAIYDQDKTTGASIWDLDELNIDPADIECIDLKWDQIEIWFKDENRQEQSFLPNVLEAQPYDEEDHEYIKWPEEVFATFAVNINGEDISEEEEA